MAALARVDPAAHLPSRVVDGNPALAALDEHDECRHRERQHHEHVQLAGAGEFQRAADGRRESRHDTREDDDRDTVAYAPLAHLLPEPHEENRAGNQGCDGRDSEAPSRVDDHRKGAGLLGLQRYRDPEGLKQRKRHRSVPRVPRDLPPARLALFPQLLQSRIDVGKELHDD